MKIGMIGCQGSGKTTKAFELCYELKKEGLDVQYVLELARKCPFDINKDSVDKTEYWIIGKTLEEEQEITGDIVITDRTLLDNLAYGLYFHKDKFESLKPFVKEYMKTYDLIFLMEPNDDYLIDDGVRDTNKQFRDDIDKTIIDLINELNVSVIISDDIVGSVKEYVQVYGL